MNPAGGGGRAERRWARLEPEARRRFPALTVYRGTEPGDLRERACQLASSGRPVIVIAAGGDGTSHEVVNGLIAAGPPAGAVMGWLPLGSGNDLAIAAGWPRDPRAVIEAWDLDSTRRIDVGIVEYRDSSGRQVQRGFGNSLTLGLTTAVLRIVRQRGRPRRGRAGYFLAAIEAILRRPAREITIRGDAEGPGTGAPPAGRNAPLFEGPALLVSLTSGPAFGAGMAIAPGARLDDGQLDLVTVPGLTRFEALRVLPGVYRGAHLRHPRIARRAVTRVTIDTKGLTDLEADGELIEAAAPPVDVAVRPACLTILSPRR